MRLFLILLLVIANSGCWTATTVTFQKKAHLQPISLEHLKCHEDGDCEYFCQCCHQCHWENCHERHTPPCHLDQELLEEVEAQLEAAIVIKQEVSVTQLYQVGRLTILKRRDEDVKRQREYAKE